MVIMKLFQLKMIVFHVILIPVLLVITQRRAKCAKDHRAKLIHAFCQTANAQTVTFKAKKILKIV
jgi:hypothetical protein